MKKLNVKKVVIFKHGVSYFILKGIQKGSGTFELEFKIDEMNDILKSLFVLDTSQKGFISSISYDAALDSSQLLKSIMLEIPDKNVLTSFLTQIKGAKADIIIGTDLDKITGIIMGIEIVEKLKDEIKVHEKLLVLLKDDGVIVKIAFSEITSFEILNEDIKNDLKFYLDTIIAGKKKDSKNITINCESGGADEVEREIFVSYIRESPVWKTSYRLIMSKEQANMNKCLLSGWCMVENTTNQDWVNIELSLVAGMPVSFVYDFYRPIFITRPRINPPKVLSAKPTEIEEGTPSTSYKTYAAKEEMPMHKPSAPPAGSPRGGAPPKQIGRARARGIAFSSVMDDATIVDKIKSSTHTQTKDLGELFEYNISNPVTIKRKQSALVPILTEEIKAKQILMYIQGEYQKNPNACLEITNNSSLTLERGPVTIIYDNNLAGEAIIPFMNKDDTRILNYAVEQAVVINQEQKTENQRVHRVSFNGAYCYEHYYTDLTTIYKINNKTDEEKILYLDHSKKNYYKVIEKPVEPEETFSYWRFKLTLKPKDAVKVNIKEQKENSTSYYIWNWSKDDIYDKLSFYIQKRFIDESVEQLLKEVAALIGQ